MWAWSDFLLLSTWSVYDLTRCSNIPEQSACVILLSVTWASCVWSYFLLPEQAVCDPTFCYLSKLHVWSYCDPTVTWASCVCDPTFCYLSKLRVWSYCYLSKLCVWSYFLLPEQAVCVILLSVTWASCVCDPTVTWASCACDPTFCYLSKLCVWSYFLLPEQAVRVILLSITWASCLNDPKDYWLHEQVVSMIWLSISISVSVYLSKLPAWFNAGIGHALPEKVALCDLTVHLLPVQVSCMITQFGLCILPVQAVYVISQFPEQLAGWQRLPLGWSGHDLQQYHTPLMISTADRFKYIYHNSGQSVHENST